MKIIIKEKLADTPRNLIRRCGYGEISNREGEISYTKRLGRDQYPRLHAYLEEKADSFAINLHLDMKQPSYEGSHAHSGEYEGVLLDKEGERIKSIITS